ncbi:hypothetical protein PDESU_03323 [Pontiella desulfatans]|uniref:Uncharacterized protein n=1 Tax=Pontiella desulfatans TaxID=2750659 RepID=A0A6C2U5I3_PONDE|nr:hypothetical protein PDESU_03323 [Pontiella desulfatans]
MKYGHKFWKLRGALRGALRGVLRRLMPLVRRIFGGLICIFNGGHTSRWSVDDCDMECRVCGADLGLPRD